VTLSSVGVMFDGTPTDVRPSFAERLDIGGGRAIVTFDSCDLKAQSAQQGVAKVEVVDGHASIDVDVARLAWTTAGDKVTDLVAVPVTLEKIDGTTSKVDITAALALANDPFSARAANVAKQPLVDAPAVDSVPRPRPIAVVWDETVKREYLLGVAPASAPYIAVVDSDYASAGSCGPYEAYAGASRAYATKKQWKASAKLYEARTGKLVAQRAFAGSYPECPYTIMMSAYGSAQDVTGTANEAAVKAWLKSLQR
jgi:hypothetical protein